MSQVLTDVFEPGTGGESCLAVLPGGLSAWQLYLNLFSEVQSAPDSAPYHRPAHMFKDYFGIPQLLQDWKVASVVLWIGHDTTASALHSDGKDNLYVVLQGTKRFLIFPPSESATAMVYPPAVRTSISGQTWHHDHSEQVTEAGSRSSDGIFSMLGTTNGSTPFPEQAASLRSRGYEVELKEGEGLYLPARWLHQVSSESAASGGHMALSFWFDPGEGLDDRTWVWNETQRYGPVDDL